MMDLRKVQRFCNGFIRTKKLKIPIAIGWIHRRWPDVVAARSLLTAFPLLTRLFAPLLETCEKVDPSTGLSYTQWPSTIRVFTHF